MKKFKLRKIIPIIMSAALALNSVCVGFFANGSVTEAAVEGEESGLIEIYTSDGAASPVKAVLIPETIADKDYNMATVSLECASDTQFNEYCELSVVITVNGEEKTFSQKGTGGYEDAWKGSFDITDGISIKQGETYKVEAYTYAYGVKGKDYVYKASLLLSFQGFSGGDDNSGDDTDTSLAEIYTSDGADSPVKTVLIPETIADKDYNMATVSLECASDTQFNEYCELSVVITVNGEEKTFSQKGTGGYEDAWKGSFDITDGISIKQGETYKVEAYTYAYGVKGKDYVYKASLLLSFQGSSGGDDNSGDDTDTSLAEIYTSDGADSPVKTVLIPETIADKDYNMATVSLECASDTQFNEYCELSVVITVNGEEKTFSQKGTGGYEDAWKGSFDITDGISIKQGETYKVEAYTYAYGVKGKDYVYKASLLLSFQGSSGGDDNSGDDTDTSLAEIYTSDGADSPVKTVLIPETIADKDYNMATVSLECASDTQFNEYCELSVVITVNGEEKTFSQKGTGGYEDAWKGSFDITDGISIKQGETYKVEAYTYAYGVKGKDYVYKASLLLSFQGSSGGDDNSGDGDTQEPDRVQVDIKSSKLSFTYEKTGETDATFLKVSGMDVNGFNGNGTYEIDILESAWNTWDKTGYYNLGFVESDAAYTLKNVVVTVNGTYEFVLEEIKAASYKEDENLYKVDFINMWSGHKEGDVLYTSKDGKAALVSGGNTAVISLMVDKAAVPTPKPFLPPYAVTPPTTAPVATTAPTAAPTAAPTVAPTTAPTSVPTVNPTTVPTVTPVATVAPTKEPVTAPSSKPEEPSDKPDGANDIQKGDKVTVSGQKYEVTNNSKKTVAYVAAKGSKKASVSVPATVKVTVNGKKVTYKVTSIKDKAFKGNKKIKTITVSKNITSIGKDAFKNCGKLKTIVIKSTSITKVGKDALKGTAKNLVIKVPANKVSAYKKLFKNKGNNNIIVKKA